MSRRLPVHGVTRRCTWRCSDLGCKNNIVRCLQKRGCRLTVLPGTTTAAELAALNPRRPHALQRPRRPGRERGNHREHP